MTILVLRIDKTVHFEKTSRRPAFIRTLFRRDNFRFRPHLAYHIVIEFVGLLFAQYFNYSFLLRGKRDLGINRFRDQLNIPGFFKSLFSSTIRDFTVSDAP